MGLGGLFSVEDMVARLTGSHCQSCAAVEFPGRHLCGQCGGRELSTKGDAHG